MEYITNSAEETRNMARNLAAQALPGSIYCLTGDLGVGKTVFAKGFGLGLGVQAEITSPTFTLLNIYEGPRQRLPLYHFDMYRLNGPADMAELGFEDYFYGAGVCLVEWAEIIKELIPSSAVWITLEKDLSVSEDYRRITVIEDKK
jgi:tRNA threonylcarbamoyladenosine biosynthesis protein TsaE